MSKMSEKLVHFYQQLLAGEFMF